MLRTTDITKLTGRIEEKEFIILKSAYQGKFFDGFINI